MEEKILNRINTCIQRYDKLQKESPYHLNVIEELHANENAHSRILAKLFQYKNINGEYNILKSFIEYIKETNKDTDFGKIIIKEPRITQEEERIDIWIRDFNYAIIIENKIYEAGDQNNQISRYIGKTKQCHYKDEQIFVIYMPNITRETSNQTWGNYRSLYQSRFAIISFCEDVIFWLKKRILPNLTLKEIYLKSAIEQYIDYLERYAGIFEKNEQQRMLEMLYEICEIKNTDAEIIQYDKLMGFHKDLNQYMEIYTKESNDILKAVLNQFVDITKKYYGNDFEIKINKDIYWIQIYKQEWLQHIVHFEWFYPSFFEEEKLIFVLHAEKNKNVWEKIMSNIEKYQKENNIIFDSQSSLSYPICFERTFYIKEKVSFSELSEEGKGKFLLRAYEEFKFLIDIVDSSIKELKKINA